MNAAIASERIPDIRAQAKEITKRQMQQWFDWMDGILDVHRSNFVFREATPAELDEHKIALKLAIRTCHLINAMIADPDFNEPELVSRLHVRIQQLADAYNTFRNSKLSAIFQRLNSSALALNLPQNGARNETAMKQRTHPLPRNKLLDYPEETEGSRLAAKGRQLANSLTAEQRREHFRRGIVRIYGSTRCRRSLTADQARKLQA